MRERSRARGWALQVLYAWEMRGGLASILDVLAEFMADRRIAQTSRDYLFRLLETVEQHRADLDREIAAAVTNWRPERLSSIDRNILRIGAAELLYIEEVPPRVTLQEAILLAEKYGTGESPRFVNGVLDAVMRRVTPRHGETA